MKQIKVPISSRLSGRMRVSMTGIHGFADDASPTNNLRGEIQRRDDGRFKQTGKGRGLGDLEHTAPASVVDEHIFGKSGELKLMRGAGLYNYLSEEFDDDSDIAQDLEEGFDGEKGVMPQKLNKNNATPRTNTTTDVTKSGMPTKSPKLNNRTV